MSQPIDAFNKIQQHEEQIAALKNQVADDLQFQIDELNEQIAGIDTQIFELTGKPVAPSSEQKTLPGRNIPLSELKELLALAPEKTLNIRQEGLQLANIKTLARVNPHLLRIGGNGAWPTVTLLR